MYTHENLITQFFGLQLEEIRDFLDFGCFDDEVILIGNFDANPVVDSSQGKVKMCLLKGSLPDKAYELKLLNRAAGTVSSDPRGTHDILFKTMEGLIEELEGR